MVSEFDELLGADALADCVTAEALGEILGITARAVRGLAQEGVIPRTGKNAHPQSECIRAYCDHLREKAAGRSASSSLTAERVRVAQAQAEKLERQNAVARAELVSAREVETTWSNVLRDVRAAMLTLPTRLGQRLGHMTPHDLNEVDAEVRRLLEEVGND